MNNEDKSNDLKQGPFERVFTVVSIAAGIVGILTFLLSILGRSSVWINENLSSAAWDEAWGWRYLIAAVGCFCIIMLLLYKYLVFKSKLKRARRKTAEIQKEQRRTISSLQFENHTALQIYLAITKSLRNQNRLAHNRQEITAETFAIISKRVRDAVDDLCSCAAREISLITECNTHVCLKTLHGQQVRVPGRGKVNGVRNYPRSVLEYIVEENTALWSCIEARHQNMIFLSNDLVQFPSFQYPNHNWRELFNAVLAVPIEKNPTVNIKDEGIWGFIWADNIEGNFDDEGCAALLRKYGDMIYRILEIYGNLEFMMQHNVSSIGEAIPNEIEGTLSIS